MIGVIVFYVIPKWRAKRVKKIYESYYWLVTHIDPYNDYYCLFNNPRAEQFKTVMREIAEEKYGFTKESYNKKYTSLISLLRDARTGKFPSIIMDEILIWYVRKGVPAFRIGEDRITSLAHLKRLSREMELQEIKFPATGENSFHVLYDKYLYTMKIYSSKIEAYLYDQHRENLRKLSQAEEKEK